MGVRSCAGFAVFVGLATSACANRQLTRTVSELETIALRASHQGAALCAPEELALARVHLEFARFELSQGDPTRAQRHLVIAEPNARAALRVTSSPSCADTQRATMSSSRPLAAAASRRGSVRGAP